MKANKLLRIIRSRVIIFGLIILGQIGWLCMMFTRLVSYSGWISTGFQTISVLVLLYILKKDEVPAYRLSWIILILALPVLGGVAYLFLGGKSPSIPMRRKLKRGREGLDYRPEPDAGTIDSLKSRYPRAAGTASYVSEKAGFPLWEHTAVKYHSGGESHFEDMLKELKKAEKFIFLEYFILERGLMWDSILDILAEKARKGVDVRLIYDDMGCVKRIPAKYNRSLEAMGIRCIAFNRFIPVFSLVMNNRDHRKIMVIDGKTAFTGGVNLADEYINKRALFGRWKDSGLMLKGRAAESFTELFLEMWDAFRPEDAEGDRRLLNAVRFEEPRESDGFVQPFGDSPLDSETVSANVYLDILSQAEDYVYIFTPYLAIGDELQLALCQAAKRGVDVRMVLPGVPDKKVAFRLTRSYYGPLLKAGVRLYEYKEGFIHAKSYVCDDRLALVGTINMDFRSLYLHFECGVLMYGCSAVADVKRDALETFKISREIHYGDRHRGPAAAFFGGLYDSVLRVVAPLF